MTQDQKAIAAEIHARNLKIMALVAELDDLCMSLDVDHIPLVLNRQKKAIVKTPDLPKNSFEIFCDLCDRAEDFLQLTKAFDWLYKPKQYSQISELDGITESIRIKMEEASDRIKKHGAKNAKN